jgi:hypothetical protein
VCEDCSSYTKNTAEVRTYVLYYCIPIDEYTVLYVILKIC